MSHATKTHSKSLARPAPDGPASKSMAPRAVRTDPRSLARPAPDSPASKSMAPRAVRTDSRSLARPAPDGPDSESMGPGAVVRRRWQASAFSPVLASPVLRRLLPALAVSAIGDGMSAVGVAWLAIRIASPADRGLVVGVAVAAYTLPGAAGAVVLARPLRRLAGCAWWLRTRRCARWPWPSSRCCTRPAP